MGNKKNRKLVKRSLKKYFKQKGQNISRYTRRNKEGGVSENPEIPITTQDGSKAEAQTQNKDLDICLQIKNSLKLLRQQSDSCQEVAPALELEVFPEKRIETVPIEFVDESQPPEEEPNKRTAKTVLAQKRFIKGKIPQKLQLLKKQFRRNPRRLTVLKKQIKDREEKQKADLIEAQKAPPVEQVYLSSGFKVHKDPVEKEVTSTLMHKEQLYEFGKYIAEQLISFDEKDVTLAQTEIKEVLTKYRLKYKIMHCLTKSSTSNNSVKPVDDNQASQNTKSNHLSQIKKPNQVSQIKNSAASSVTQMNPPVVHTMPSLHSLLTRPSHTPGADKRIYTKHVKAPNTAGETVPTGPTATQATKPVIPKATQPRISFVIVPSTNPSGFQIVTERVQPDGTVVTQPANVGMPQSAKSLANAGISTHPCLPLVNSVPSMIQSVVTPIRNPSQFKPSLPHVVIGPQATDPSSQSNACLSVAELELQSRQIVGALDPSPNTESLVVKCEVDSDEEE